MFFLTLNRGGDQQFSTFLRLSIVLALLIASGQTTTSIAGCLDEEPGDSTSHIKLSPDCTELRVGETYQITCQGSTALTEVRGGGVAIDYDPLVFSISPASADKAPASPFGLIIPDQEPGQLKVGFVFGAMFSIAHAGDLFTFNVTVLAPSPAAGLTLVPALTRWSPAIDGTLLSSGEFNTAVPRAFGDFDASGCTDINDCLFLLDNWTLEVDGTPIGIDDLLNLLDNYGSGPACA